MAIRHIIIMLKLSAFIFFGMLFQISLSLVINVLVLPNLKENIEYVYFNHFYNIPFNFFSMSLMFGFLIFTFLTVLLSWYLAYTLIKFTVGWKNEQKYFGGK